MERTQPGSPKPALLIGGLALLIAAVLSAVAFVNNDQDPLIFAHIGTRFAKHDANGTVGYDGQFAYFIARDGAAAVPYIDGPSLRFQRIVYPLVSRALSLGNPELVPWTLILVNVVALGLGTGLLAYVLLLLGGPPQAALIYGVWFGSLISVRLDLNETLCFALALAAILTYLYSRYMWTILLLMLAALTKEPGLVIAAGLGLHALARGRWRWAGMLFGGPALLFVTWWGILLGWFGTLPTRYPAGRISFIPLSGMFTEDNPLELLVLIIWLGIPAVVLLLMAVRSVWLSRQVTLGAALVIPGSVFVMLMPAVSWQDPAAAFRVGLPLIITGILFIGQCCPRRWTWLAGMWGPSVLLVLLIPGLWFNGA